MSATPDAQLQGEMAIGRLLALASLRGYWSVDQLNARRPGVKAGERNLALEWIQANPREWQEHCAQAGTSATLDHLPSGPDVLQAFAGVSAGYSQF